MIRVLGMLVGLNDGMISVDTKSKGIIQGTQRQVQVGKQSFKKQKRLIKSGNHSWKRAYQRHLHKLCCVCYMTRRYPPAIFLLFSSILRSFARYSASRHVKPFPTCLVRQHTSAHLFDLSYFHRSSTSSPSRLGPSCR